MIAQVHVACQYRQGSAPRCPFLADGEHVICENLIYEIDEWFQGPNIEWCLNFEPELTIMALRDVIEDERFDGSDERDVDRLFYEKMHQILFGKLKYEKPDVDAGRFQKIWGTPFE